MRTLHERAGLRALPNAASDPGERQKLQHELAGIEQQIAVRLEVPQK